jgi:hypothetical protein
MKKILFTVILLTLCSLCVFGQGRKSQTTIVNVKQQNVLKEKKPKSQCAPKKIIIGLDLGIGGGFYEYLDNYNNYVAYGNGEFRDDYFGYEPLDMAVAFSLGPRFTWHFNSYLGVDFIKINGNFGLFSSNKENYYNIQFMAGVRGNTPSFYKCMSGYAAARFGYGIGKAKYEYKDRYSRGSERWTDTGWRNEKINGFCWEVELGMNITRTILVGFSYNWHDFSVWGHTFALRVGFNFGK